MRHRFFPKNETPSAILFNAVVAAISLFVNGFGVYLTIHAEIGASPWDVFNLGLSKTFGILYGTASIVVSFTVLFIDLILREPIGIAMVIDAIVVGKSVDLFNSLSWIPVPKNPVFAILMMLFGFVIIGYTQFTYMAAALGCGPRDTLLVGLKKRIRKIPIGLVSVILLAFVTLVGWLLGGTVGYGTLIAAFSAGPIMQLSFKSVGFDATEIQHQNVLDSFRVFAEMWKPR